MNYLYKILIFLIVPVVELNDDEKCKFGFVFNGRNCEICGRSVVVPDFKISGGVIAKPYSWPAQVFLYINYKTQYNFGGSIGIKNLTCNNRCGGSLISPKTVLTAAHCLSKTLICLINGFTLLINFTKNEETPTFESIFKVYLGAHDVSFIEQDKNKTKNSSSIIEMDVSEIKIHPGYNESTYSNDIALLILKSPVKSNKFIKFACLPNEKSDKYPKENQDAIAVGWGMLHFATSYLTKLLRNVKIKIYNFSICEKTYKNLNPKSQICAGDLKGKKDTCGGDSGGPLYVYDNTKKRYILAGITSYGDDCGTYGQAGIYTRTSFFINWIKNNYE